MFQVATGSIHSEAEYSILIFLILFIIEILYASILSNKECSKISPRNKDRTIYWYTRTGAIRFYKAVERRAQNEARMKIISVLLKILDTLPTLYIYLYHNLHTFKPRTGMMSKVLHTPENGKHEWWLSDSIVLLNVKLSYSIKHSNITPQNSKTWPAYDSLIHWKHPKLSCIQNTSLEVFTSELCRKQHTEVHYTIRLAQYSSIS